MFPTLEFLLLFEAKFVLPAATIAADVGGEIGAACCHTADVEDEVRAVCGLQMVTYGCRWLQMVAHGCTWSQMIVHGCKWLYMVAHGYV